MHDFIYLFNDVRLDEVILMKKFSPNAIHSYGAHLDSHGAWVLAVGEQMKMAPYDKGHQKN